MDASDCKPDKPPFISGVHIHSLNIDRNDSIGRRPRRQLKLNPDNYGILKTPEPLDQ